MAKTLSEVLADVRKVVDAPMSVEEAARHILNRVYANLADLTAYSVLQHLVDVEHATAVAVENKAAAEDELRGLTQDIEGVRINLHAIEDQRDNAAALLKQELAAYRADAEARIIAELDARAIDLEASVKSLTDNVAALQDEYTQAKAANDSILKAQTASIKQNERILNDQKVKLRASIESLQKGLS